jgi:hypothetical protein
VALTPVKGKFAALAMYGTIQPAMNYTLPISANIEDVSNFRDGRQVCPTLDNATGISFQLVHDESASVLPTMTAGSFGTLKCFVDAAQSKFYQMVVCLGEISLVNAGVQATQKLNVTASLHGTIAYPS